MKSLIEAIETKKYQSVCYIIFKNHDQEDRNEEIGKLVNFVHRNAHDYFFERNMWASAFLLSTDRKDEFEQNLNPTLLSIHTNHINNFSVFDDLKTSKTEIEKQLDLMGMQLNKIDYWQEHPYEYYFKNGEKMMLGGK